MKTVAVAGGTGGLGKFIVEALKENSGQIKIIILSRKQQPGCVCVDYNKEETLVAALKDVDYVVSALGTLATGEEQKTIMRAAKKAGVKMFFPSEFGADTSLPEIQSTSVLKPKIEAAKYAETIGLPTCRVMTGFFIDTFFLPWFGIDLENSKGNIVGDGNKPVSFTHRKDVGRLIAQLIIKNEFQPVVRTGPETKTPNEAFAIYEGIKHVKLNITRESIPEVKKKINDDSKGDVMEKAIDSLKMLIAEGYALNKQPLYNGNLPKFITVKEYFEKI